MTYMLALTSTLAKVDTLASKTKMPKVVRIFEVLLGNAKNSLMTTAPWSSHVACLSRQRIRRSLAVC